MSSNYYGIDYGRGQTNIDKSTGIRFGVIPIYELHESAYEDFEPEYDDPSCPKCGNDDTLIESDSSKDYKCLDCDEYFWNDDCFPENPNGYHCRDKDYDASYSGEDRDVFVEKSPYFTYAQFCSPCAPGACYLLNPVDTNGPKAYCFGHDWFEDGKAPYPVYRVDTGELVEPTNG